jgi:hypothetical protein
MERRSIAAEFAGKGGAAHDILRPIAIAHPSLIAIAHPNFRDELRVEARTIGYVT